MFIYIESAIIIMLEVLCCRIFYGAFRKKRNNGGRWRERALLFLLMLEFFCSALLFENILLLKVCMIVMGITIVMFRIVEIRFVTSLVMAFLYEGLMFVADYLAFLLCMAVFGDAAEIDSMYYVQGGLFVLLDKMILFLFVLAIRKAAGKYETGRMEDSQWLKFIFFPIYTICTILGMMFLPEMPGAEDKNHIFFMIAFGLVGMNMAVFYFLCDSMKRENEMYENRMFRLQMKNQTEMYYSISENLERQRKKSHEYKNQLLCMESLLQRNRVKEAKDYMERIGDVWRAEADNICTNHVMVDAILNMKYSEMMEKKIAFVFRINDLSPLTLSDEDLVVILSNLLNNAIEACEKCHQRRMIKLKFVIEKDNLILSVKNTYENELLQCGGIFLTTKSGEADHGIGMSNIVSVIEKNGGSYVIKPEDGMFYFSAVIPQNKEMVLC